ncbi:cytoplasm protein [Schizosaccharomyces japonicus yFS275]|uniref:Cytoplasm protein n=1 Tax=Schizosaccharomyces japonicus (strain yFS275 / FY16936) TaxID=402676 RepID=B6K6M3_SCHJY|nr:cytoplasm protein [Schizosaccharomyces japonicus yFS275]EEB09177.2 cytoplasm protein [Schizosaccharomyces japonicus yFS275]
MSSVHSDNQEVADVLIIGGGIVGVCTAFFITKRPEFAQGKLRVVLLEENDIACAASGKAGGFLALDWHGKPTESLSTLSYRLHEKLAEEYNGAKKWDYRKVKTLSMSLMPAGNSQKLPEDMPWFDTQCVEKYSTLGTPSTTSQIQPYKFCQEIFRLAHEAGVRLVKGKAVDVHATYVTYVPEGANEDDIRRFDARKVVVCAGPWTGNLMPETFIDGTRVHSICLRNEHVPNTPYAIFTDIVLPDGENSHPEIFSRSDHWYVSGAPDMHPLPNSSKTVTVKKSRCEDIKHQLDSVSSMFRDSTITVEQACYLPTSSRTGLPIIGCRKDGVYIASGHSCWGITQGPGTGYVMSELLFDGKIKSADCSYLAY